MLEVVSLQLATVALRNMEGPVVRRDLMMSFAVVEVGELLTGVNVIGFRRLMVGCVVLCHLTVTTHT